MTFNVGEKGRPLIVHANYDMSAKTALSLTITRPDGTVIERTGSDVTISASPYVSSTGTLQGNKYAIYAIKAGDLTVPGEYLVMLRYDDATLTLLARSSFPVSE